MECHFYTKKDPLLNCVSYTNTFIFTILDAALCSLKLMGFLPLTSLGTEAGPTWTILVSLKVMAVKSKKLD